MNLELKQQLDDLLDCSRRLLEQAKAGDWMAVRNLQGHYRELAEVLFSRPVPAADLATITAVVRDVIQINRQVMDMGAVEQQACLNEMGVHRQRRQAVSEYTANQPQGSS